VTVTNIFENLVTMTVTVTGSWSFLPDATAVIQGYHGHGHGP
jgi:hypothetical protein